MISRAEAETVARGYLGTDVEIHLEEFELGFMAWKVAPPRPDPTVPPPTSGYATVVVDKETGELTTWGSQPPSFIAEQYAAHRAALRRFPEDVREALKKCNWWPGRNKSEAVSRWLAEPQVAQALQGIEIYPQARALLDEFAGLTILQFGPGGRNLGGGFTSRIYPVDYELATDRLRDFTRRTGVRATPIGSNEEGPATLVVAADGRVFLLHWVDDFFVADNIDEAVIWMVRGGDLPEADLDDADTD
jgi:hypothetical protein